MSTRQNINRIKLVSIRSLKKSVLTAMLFLSALAYSADFTLDFQRPYQESVAEGLFAQATNYPAAREAFEKLAATAKDAIEKAMWQARAAEAVGLQNGKLEEGLAMAKSIDDKPYSVQSQIELMLANKDYTGIVNRFGQEDIAAWPPRRIAMRTGWAKDEDARGMALYHRGYAYYRTGAGAAAEKDLEKAAEFAVNNDKKVAIYRDLADMEAQLLKNKEKAFEINMRLTHLQGAAPVYIGFLGAADYLREQKKYDEALELLRRMPLPDEPMEGNGWPKSKLFAIGHTLAEAGKTEEAIAVYDKIIASEKYNDSDKKEAKKELEKLQKPSK